MCYAVERGRSIRRRRRHPESKKSLARCTSSLALCNARRAAASSKPMLVSTRTFSSLGGTRPPASFALASGARVRMRTMGLDRRRGHHRGDVNVNASCVSDRLVDRVVAHHPVRARGVVAGVGGCSHRMDHIGLARACRRMVMLMVAWLDVERCESTDDGSPRERRASPAAAPRR